MTKFKQKLACPYCNVIEEIDHEVELEAPIDEDWVSQMSNYNCPNCEALLDLEINVSSEMYAYKNHTWR